MQSATFEEMEEEDVQCSDRVNRLNELYPQLKLHRLMNDTEYRDIAALLARPGIASDTIWHWLNEVTQYMQRLNRRTGEPTWIGARARSRFLAFRI